MRPITYVRPPPRPGGTGGSSSGSGPHWVFQLLQTKPVAVMVMLCGRYGRTPLSLECSELVFYNISVCVDYISQVLCWDCGSPHALTFIYATADEADAYMFYSFFPVFFVFCFFLFDPFATKYRTTVLGNGWTDFHETFTKRYRGKWSFQRRAAAWRMTQN